MQRSDRTAPPLSERCIGRWRGILVALGIKPEYLTGRHTPCPFCGGKDRFRFADDKGLGTAFCNQCGDSTRGGYLGTGVDLAKRLLKTDDFKVAAVEIERHVGGSALVMPKAADRGRLNDRAMGLWQSGLPLDGEDPASTYLRNRGIVLVEYPKMLRWMGCAPYTHEDKRRTFHPAMLALFVGPDTNQRTLHVTYLTDDGRKADLAPARKLAPGAVPRGGSVRLANSAETIGVAEGIETALSAMILHDVPVWATLSAGQMINFQPPTAAKNIIVFGDNDVSCTGQSAAYGLAHRLITEGRRAEVRLPDMAHAGPKGADWNDVVMAGGVA